MKFLEAKGLPKGEKGEHKMQPGVREDQRGMLRGNRSDVTPGLVSGVNRDDAKKKGSNKPATTKPSEPPVSGVTEDTNPEE